MHVQNNLQSSLHLNSDELAGGSRQVIEADVIDDINILEASLCAMEQAVGSLEGPQPDLILIDGNQKPRVKTLLTRSFSVISSFSRGFASIMAAPPL